MYASFNLSAGLSIESDSHGTVGTRPISESWHRDFICLTSLIFAIGPVNICRLTPSLEPPYSGHHHHVQRLKKKFST
ncbi:hypothetical protein O9929_11240 [Vibrio lentus]|nr:hypothetical protein [Vibrio lentus]